ncbi:RyR domain-containing protein [Trebonia sp.]|uniref:RyR domain-containing protein n=1 Tax=Trebonia sp. TaxID=2767075 RepID=UPI0026146387|nr:RyR domain-containing protein [Trebonia sp.]
MRKYTDEEIARVIHAANAELQRIQGDPAPSLPWDSETGEIRQGAIDNVAYARDGVTTATLHEAWLRDKAAHGWTYGPEKDSRAKTHPCMVPYGELPAEQRDKSRLFVAIVRALTHDMY